MWVSEITEIGLKLTSDSLGKETELKKVSIQLIIDYLIKYNNLLNS